MGGIVSASGFNNNSVRPEPISDPGNKQKEGKMIVYPSSWKTPLLFDRRTSITKVFGFHFPDRTASEDNNNNEKTRTAYVGGDDHTECTFRTRKALIPFYSEKLRNLMDAIGDCAELNVSEKNFLLGEVLASQKSNADCSDEMACLLQELIDSYSSTLPTESSEQHLTKVNELLDKLNDHSLSAEEKMELITKIKEEFLVTLAITSMEEQKSTSTRDPTTLNSSLSRQNVWIHDTTVQHYEP